MTSHARVYSIRQSRSRSPTDSTRIDERAPMGTRTSMEALVLVLLLIGAICFGLAAFGVPARVNWVALGLLAWILTVLIPAVART